MGFDRWYKRNQFEQWLIDVDGRDLEKLWVAAQEAMRERAAQACIKSVEDFSQDMIDREVFILARVRTAERLADDIRSLEVR